MDEATTETLEHQQNKAEDKVKHKPWLFTRENARDLAFKSIESRKQREAQDRLDKARLEQEARVGREMLMAEAIKTEPVPACEPALTYVAKQLACVREQLEQINGLIREESDAQKLDRLVSAQSKLREQERILDGRPLPGSRRPKQDRPVRTNSSTGPLED